jgi:hypothetical protein
MTNKARAPLNVAVAVDVGAVAEVDSIVENEVADMVALAVDVEADEDVPYTVLIGVVAGIT